MAGTESIINLGDLSKAANTLVEKISEAIGGIFRPYQIRRIAQAEADAERIRAVSQIEITALQRRAVHRFMIEEAKRQQNIESITSKALPRVDDEASPENVEDDWITNFFDKCRLISDIEMQDLWAKVLAGEANSPGKYSKRTVNLLASLDKTDAELFSSLCSFAVELGGLVPLIYDTEASIYTEHEIHFSSLSHLDSIGLIQFDSLAGFVRTGLSQKGFIPYYDEKLWIEFTKLNKSNEYEMRIGKVLLTKVGQQLAPICGSKSVDGFPSYLKEKWKGLGYQIEQKGPIKSQPNL
jgi:hypothetical protein